MELNDRELDTVTGGAGSVPLPTATGGVTYQCTECKTVINASTRDTQVTCPNMKCRCRFQVSGGKLKLIAKGV